MAFGPSPVSNSELLGTVVQSFLPGAPKDAQTSSLKHALDKLGASLGHTVFITEPAHPRGGRELLLDLAWWQPGRGAVLACQCAWGNAGEIAYKFERLLAVKAPQKLLIFASRRAGAEREDIRLRTDIDAVLQVLGAALIDFDQHVAGETYVLLEHVESNSAFHAYEFRVEEDGKLPFDFPQAKMLFRRIELAAAKAA